MKLSSFTLALIYISGAIGYSNIASEGIASQSDVAHGGDAFRAIDGNTNPEWKYSSVTYTATQGKTAWWRLTFSSDYVIDEVRIWNRFDHADHIIGATVYVGDKYIGRVDKAKSIYRFLKIAEVASEITIKGGTGYLMLAEVEVFGESYCWSNIANKGIAVQSKNLSPTQGLAEVAIDGNTYGHYSGRSVTAADGSNQWWKLQFDEERYIKFIVIYNRVDAHTVDLNGASIILNGKQVGEVCHKVGRVSYVFDVDERTKEIKIVGGTGRLMLAEVKVFGYKI